MKNSWVLYLIILVSSCAELKTDAALNWSERDEVYNRKVNSRVLGYDSTNSSKNTLYESQGQVDIKKKKKNKSLGIIIESN